MDSSKGFLGVIGLVIVLAVGCFFATYERIPAGYVGVVYSMNGGVQDEALEQGVHFISPTKHINKFTIGNEQLVLSKDSREGSEEDDSFAVATSDNANIDISFQMSYRFDKSCVVETYKRFKGMDGDDIVSNRARTVLKSKVSEVTHNYSMMDLYSGSRDKINRELTEYLNNEFHKQFGIEVIDASIVDVHPDAQLQKTIADRVTAMQKKQQAQAEQQTIKVENETKIIQAESEAKQREISAKADAEVKRIEAEAEAEEIRIKAEAEAEANKKVAESLTPELIDKIRAEKWNGQYPQVMSDGSTIMDMRG